MWSRLSWFPAMALLSMSALAETPDSPGSTLVEAPGADLVRAHCSACHSLALVAQNRMSRERWLATIRWMQDKQGLWDLGGAEAPIIDYLARNYGITEPRWRRRPLNWPACGPDRESADC